MPMPDSRSLPRGPTPRCARVRPHLALLHTGALTPRAAAAVHDHLAGCYWCQRELAAYAALDAAARQHLAGAAFVPLTLEDIMHATDTSPDANLTPTREIRRRPRLATLGPLAAVVALVLLAGVLFAQHRAGPGVGLSGTPTPPSLTQTTWTLTRLVVDGREVPLVPGHAPTLVLGPFNGQILGIQGEGGCNEYYGTYTQAGDTLRFGGIGLWGFMDACGNPVGTEQVAYLQALGRVERYHLDRNTLTLTSADGSMQLIFRAK